MAMRKQVEDYIVDLQNRIVTAFEQADPNAPPFKRDRWERPQGGWGQSCVFAIPHPSSPNALKSDHVSILEKGGVNISVISGVLPPAAVKQMRVEHSSLPENPTGGLPFFAGGLSLVIHPRNPHAPTVHCNYRYFEVTDSDGKLISWWFGGGCDLTPSYLYEEDVVHFHKTLRDTLEPFGEDIYPAFKKWCDEYFYITHRSETRGVGGVFYDDLSEAPHARLPLGSKRPKSAEEIFKLMRGLGDSFVPSYLPILTKRSSTEYTPSERRWQLLRRGRYVEFNLVYDRGTKFGLMTPGARIESILMSLPEEARWEYQSEMGTSEDSREAKLVQVLKTPREWV